MNGQRIVLCGYDADGKLRPLRVRNGRLLVKLAADPAATDLKSVATHARLPEDQTFGLMGVESEKREKLVDLALDDQILQLEIVDGLGAITGFTNHHARHENGGADEVSVAGLSGLLADEQDPLDHAADHQNGGGDEVATATPAANAIPKAGAGGELDKDWVPDGTTTAKGKVELATDGEASSGVAVQGDDSRLARALSPFRSDLLAFFLGGAA
jgi:hypothetical protein